LEDLSGCKKQNKTNIPSYKIAICIERERDLKNMEAKHKYQSCQIEGIGPKRPPTSDNEMRTSFKFSD